jgi:cytochrome c oxidase assembly protein Cox11
MIPPLRFLTRSTLSYTGMQQNGARPRSICCKLCSFTTFLGNIHQTPHLSIKYDPADECSNDVVKMNPGRAYDATNLTDHNIGSLSLYKSLPMNDKEAFSLLTEFCFALQAACSCSLLHRETKFFSSSDRLDQRTICITYRFIQWFVTSNRSSNV